MNAKRFMELLKNIQKIMKCPSCGQSYKMEEVKFLGQIDGLFLMQMSCGKCKLPVWMNFMATRGQKKSHFKSDLSDKDIGKDIDSEITTNEIIDFHSFLNGFNGDFKGNIKKA